MSIVPAPILSKRMAACDAGCRAATEASVWSYNSSHVNAEDDGLADIDELLDDLDLGKWKKALVAN